MGDEPFYLTGEGSMPSCQCSSLTNTPSLVPCSGPALDLSHLADNPNCPMVASYYVGQKIGRGAFGCVYSGWCQEVGMPVAIKSLSKSSMATKADVARASREIALLKLLNHPNCVRLFEVVDSFAHVYLIMEYMGGGELFDLLERRGHLEESEAACYIGQLLSALAYLHSLGIAHRDIKAENIMLDASQTQAKLSDFGFSAQHTWRQFTTNCGSPLYAAPELLVGSPYDGPPVDMWALGVLLHLMVSGRYPFDFKPGNDQRENLAALQSLYRHIITGHRTQPDVTEPCRRLIDQMLCPDPKQRITATEALHHPWIMEYCDVALPPPTSPSTPRSEWATPISGSSCGSPSPLSRVSSDFGCSESDCGSLPREGPFAKLSRFFRHKPSSVQINHQCLENAARIQGIEESLLSRELRHNHRNHATALYYLLFLKSESEEADSLRPPQSDNSQQTSLPEVSLFHESMVVDNSMPSMSFSPSSMLVPPDL